MRCQCWMLVSVFLLGVAVGCGDKGPANQPAAQGTASTTDGSKSATTPEAGGPAEAVTQFLEAVRTGNDEVATKMFTPLARQKTSELDIKVAPRGSDTARFEVGKVEMVSNGEGAKVATKWSDINPKDGQTRTDEITWMLRHETEGWRVAGMAAVVFPGEPPLLLDFEQPEETMKRLDMLREEVQRRVAQENGEGQKNPAGQPVQPAEHVTDAGSAQPLRPVAKDDMQLQQPTDGRGQDGQQAGSPPSAGAVNGTREAQRNTNPSDPFQR